MKPAKVAAIFIPLALLGAAGYGIYRLFNSGFKVNLPSTVVTSGTAATSSDIPAAKDEGESDIPEAPEESDAIATSTYEAIPEDGNESGGTAATSSVEPLLEPAASTGTEAIDQAASSSDVMATGTQAEPTTATSSDATSTSPQTVQ